MNKIIIYGLGQVGANLLFSLSSKRNYQLGIIEKDINRKESVLADILPLKNDIVDLDNKDLSDYETLILCVGINNNDRTSFLKESVLMIDKIIKEIINHNFKNNLIIISNPVDILTTYISINYSKNFKNIASTGTILDSIRYKALTNNNINLLGPHGKDAIVFKSRNVDTDKLKIALNMGYAISNNGYHSSYGICKACLILLNYLSKEKENSKIILSIYDKKYNIAFSHYVYFKNGKLYPIEIDNSFYQQNLKQKLDIIQKEYLISIGK